MGADRLRAAKCQEEGTAWTTRDSKPAGLDALVRKGGQGRFLLPPTALERSVGDREGYVLRQTLLEKPAVNMYSRGYGRMQVSLGSSTEGSSLFEKTASYTAGGKGMGDTLGWTQPHK